VAQDNKYGKVDIPGIPDDEPVFIIRGKDEAAPEAVHAYGDEATNIGASDEFVESVHKRAHEIHQWQLANGDLVKIPD
jgi:hypothetical protein